MARRRRWLQPGEVVLYASRPHPVVLARSVVAALLVAALVGFGFVAWSTAPPWFGLMLGAFLLLAVVRVGAAAARWRAGLLLVTSRRIAQREGVLRRVGREIPVTKVEDVTFVQGIVGRVVGYGEVTVESAGASAARPLRAVWHPEDVQHAIHRAAEAARRPVAAPAQAPPAVDPVGPDEDLDEQLELLEGLHRRGFLSTEELEDKRRELLAPNGDTRPWPPGGGGGRW